jgi:hypothetical protein
MHFINGKNVIFLTCRTLPLLNPTKALKPLMRFFLQGCNSYFLTLLKYQMTVKLFNTLHFKSVKTDNAGTTRSKESNCKLAFSVEDKSYFQTKAKLF